jgi:hypothetical protein
MWPRNHKLEVGVICFAAMAFGWEGQAQDLTTRATGCLGSDGNLSRFALGDDPLDDCASGDDQLSLKLDDLSDGAATVPFFVTLRFGEEQIIAENGALALRARCIFGTGTSGDRLDLVVSSTLDGWLVTSAGSTTTTANLAGDEIILFTAAGQPNEGRLSGFVGDRLTGAQLALAPDGAFLALASGSTALGVNLFNQDCLAVGTASLIRGDLPEPAFGEPPTGGISGGATIGNGISGAVTSGGISVGVGVGAPIPDPASSLGGGISGFGGGGISGFGGGGISGFGGGGISQMGE